MESRLGNIDAARGHYDAALQLYQLEQEPGGLINTLVSQARLEASQKNVQQALQKYEAAFAVADASGYADHPIVAGMREEYRRLRFLTDNEDEVESLTGQLQENPTLLALAALLQAESNESLAQALADHPLLRQAEALFALAGLLNQALQAQESQSVAHLVLLFALLLEGYNDAHAEQIDAEPHAALIDLGEQLLPIARQIDADLAAGIQEVLGWLCNSLGNHFASGAGKNLPGAIAAYSRGLAFAPETPILLRNRAGCHIEAGDLPAAQADIDAAAALEPDAPRLAQLREELAKKRGSREWESGRVEIGGLEIGDWRLVRSRRAGFLPVGVGG